MKDSLQYYREPGRLTGLDDHRDALDPLPDNPAAICQVVQGLIAHGSWAKVYGFTPEPGQESYPLRMNDLLAKIRGLDPRPLSIPRLPEDRAVASCREFAVLACAILRAKGIPARARCGFAVYLGCRGTLEDHWIVEYWDGTGWILHDPQVDPFQLGMLQQWGLNQVVLTDGRRLNTGFPDPHSLSPDSDFIVGGKAWRLCRDGLLDPMKCGIEDAWGLWFVRGQLLRDFAALRKLELVPHLCREPGDWQSWQSWRLLAAADADLTGEDLALLDEIAALSAHPDNLEAIADAYRRNPALQVPEEILRQR